MNNEGTPTRKRIYATIQRFPGIHFRELSRASKLFPGELNHHTSVLRKLGLIKEEKHGRNIRFFPLGLNDFERTVLAILRNSTFRQVIMALLKKSPQNNRQLSAILNLSPSTMSEHLHYLRSKHILIMNKEGRDVLYSLKDVQEIEKVLLAHKKTFLDKMVENFIESWEK